MSATVSMYSSLWCGYCAAVRRLFAAKGRAIEEIIVDGNRALRQEMEQRTGRRTVPQIFIGSQHIGGYDELYRLERSGELDRLLAAMPPTAPANQTTG